MQEMITSMEQGQADESGAFGVVTDPNDIELCNTTFCKTREAVEAAPSTTHTEDVAAGIHSVSERVSV